MSVPAVVLDGATDAVHEPTSARAGGPDTGKIVVASTTATTNLETYLSISIILARSLGLTYTHTQTMTTHRQIITTARTWLSRHWRLQLATLGGVLLVAVVLVWLPYFQLDDRLRRGAGQASSAARQSRNLTTGLTSLIHIAPIEPGVYGSATRYADAVRAQYDGNAVTPLRSTNPLLALQPYPNPALGRTIGQTNTLARADRPHIIKLNQTLPRTRALLEYHAAVMRSLVNVLEYNPAIDFTQFDATSQDTKTRLSKAAQGLTKARGDLHDAQWKHQGLDPHIQALQQFITQLEAAQAELARTGDTARWTTTVTTTQAAILQNRTTFWRESSRRQLQDLAADQDYFARSAAAWQGLGRDLGLEVK